MYPAAAMEYYTKRGDHVNDVEEQRLREMILSAIPVGLDGWSSDLPQPKVIIKPSQVAPQTPELKPVNASEPLVLNTAFLTPSTATSPSPSQNSECVSTVDSLSTGATSPSPRSAVAADPVTFPQVSPADTPLLLEALPRKPPSGQDFVARPPPENMSREARLLCLARWTLFDTNGNPHLAREPREKNFQMDWASSGAEDDVLVKWAREMWWTIWARQYRTSYVGMWKRRFEKEDKKAEKANAAEKEKVVENEKVVELDNIAMAKNNQTAETDMSLEEGKTEKSIETQNMAETQQMTKECSETVAEEETKFGLDKILKRFKEINERMGMVIVDGKLVKV